MSQDRKYRLAINRGLIDKNAADDARLFAIGFENVEVSLDELMQLVGEGVGFCPQLSGQRSARNFLAADLAYVDVDRGFSLDEARRHRLVRDYALFIYTTVNHKPDEHRFRIVFGLPRTVERADQMRALLRSLALRLNGDPSAVDATRIAFGNRQALFRVVGRQLSEELLSDLIAQSINADQSGVTMNGGRAAVRAHVALAPDTPVKTSKGNVLPFASIARRTSVHCPLHADNRASAFVVESKTGVRAIHCSTCAATFWPSGQSELYDFDEFSRVAKALWQNHASEVDPGPFAPFYAPPEARTNLRACNIQFSRDRVAPTVLRPGLTLIKAPKGSGKTESLKRLIAGKKVLLIGHRRALLANVCRRLGIHCYLDDVSGREDLGHESYGICLDSLLKVPPDAFYDVVIFDESEQVLGHFLSDTIERQEGGGRDRIFQHLGFLVQRTAATVALDADLGWATFLTLRRMMQVGPDKPTYLHINEGGARAPCDVQLYLSKPHLIAQLMNDVAVGRRSFVTANSRRLVEDLYNAIGQKHPNARLILVTAETRSMPSQSAFLADPQERAAEYDVILTSPAVGTGVDISFPEGAQMIDVVYGFCEPLINTHLDFDQQIGRVRNPGAVKVYVTPRTFQYETNLDVVNGELLRQSLYKNLLLYYDDRGEAHYQEHDPFVDMASLILSQRRASMNALSKNFVRHKKNQGCQVTLVEPDDDWAREGTLAQRVGRQLSEAQYADRVLGATPLQWAEFSAIEEARKEGRPVSPEDLFAHERTSIELFYRQRVTAELIRRDSRGKTRKRLRAYIEFKERHHFLYRPWGTEKAALPFVKQQKLVSDWPGRVIALDGMLSRTPFFRRDFTFDTSRECEHSDLLEFAKFTAANKAEVEAQLGIEVRADVRKKPVQQLGRVLRFIGLRTIKAGSRKRASKKAYVYRLDPASLEWAERIARVRASDAWERLYEIYGWEKDWTWEPVVNRGGEEIGRRRVSLVSVAGCETPAAAQGDNT